MALFSCYVDVERFLGESVKELVHFLICLRKKERIPVILQIAKFFQYVDHIKQFYEFKETKRDEFFSSLPISNTEREILWKLLKNFYLKHSENSSGKPIPQDDLIALRKGRLFEELVFHLGPIKKEEVDLLSMHCQPMVNRERLKIYCRGKELSGKNIDVAFWGRNYVEGYECKGNVEFFIKLGFSGSEKAKKVREKILYLNQLAYTLKRYFETKIYLASFAPEIDIDWCRKTALEWVRECGAPKLNFEIITVFDFLKSIKGL
jgi:hypothetical protein